MFIKTFALVLLNLLLFNLSARNILLIDSIRIEKDDNGNVKYVNFIATQGNPQLLTDAELSLLLRNSDSFFNKYLKLSDNDEYRLIKRQVRKDGFEFERFQQFYKNIKVDDGCYTLHLICQKVCI